MTSGRAEYVPVTDEEAVGRLRVPGPHRGHHPRHRVGPRRGPRHEAGPHHGAGIRSSSSPFPAGATRTAPPSPATEGRISMSNDRTRPLRAERRLSPSSPAATRTWRPPPPPSGPQWKNGADLIELGIPFSDPTAEGPVIQGANLRALQGGVTTDQIFGLVRDLPPGCDGAPGLYDLRQRGLLLRRGALSLPPAGRRGSTG